MNLPVLARGWDGLGLTANLLGPFPSFLPRLDLSARAVRTPR